MTTETKKVLTLAEAAKYTGLSKSCLYKLTSKKKIAHYKPNGKVIFFEINELNNFLLSVRVKPEAEITDEAIGYTQTGRRNLGGGK